MSVRDDLQGKYFTGILPMVVDRLESAGFKLPAEIYGADTLTLRPPPRRRG